MTEAEKNITKSDSPPDLIFQLAAFRFVIRPVNKLGLPPYKGATLRGGFGYAFKDLVCIKPDRDCPTCLIQDRCAYYQIFETPVPKGAQMMRKYTNAPHPFVLTPPLDERTEFTAQDELTFELVLIGRAIDYLPYFIYVFDDLGRRGIGRDRSKFHLIRVDSYSSPSSAALRLCVESGLERQTIYDGSTRTLRDFAPLSFSHIKNQKCKIENPVLTLRFLTPVRIQTEGKLDHELSFTNLMKALLRRIQLLQYFHCTTHEQLEQVVSDRLGAEGAFSTSAEDYMTNGTGMLTITEIRRLLKLSESVVMHQSQLAFQDRTRYSTRQNRETSISGYTGSLTFNFQTFEPLSEFLPLLRLGEMIHIGKGTAFGLGKYHTLREGPNGDASESGRSNTPRFGSPT